MVCNPPPVGDGLGEPFGVPVAWAEGVTEATLLPAPRRGKTTTPKMPSRMMTTAATAAGMSQAGLSAGPIPPPSRRGRATGCGRAGSGADGAAATGVAGSSLGMSIA